LDGGFNCEAGLQPLLSAANDGFFMISRKIRPFSAILMTNELPAAGACPVLIRRPGIL